MEKTYKDSGQVEGSIIARDRKRLRRNTDKTMKRN